IVVYLRTGRCPATPPREPSISREDQDAFSFRSHQRALAAIDAGRFKDEIISVRARLVGVPDGAFAVDEGPRRDTSIEALAKLRPAFHAAGTVTAGNSSQTSDGASAVVITSAERARQRGLTPM